MCRASSHVEISSPSTSIVAIFVSALRRSTTRHASSTRVPAMYRSEILRTIVFGTAGSVRTIARSSRAIGGV